MERSFTIEQTAAVLANHPQTVRREIRRGRLQHYRAGRVLRVPFGALTAYMRGDEPGELRHIARRPCLTKKRIIATESAAAAELQNA